MTGNDPGPSPKRSQKKLIGSRVDWQSASLALAIPGYLLSGPLVGLGLGWAAVNVLGLPSWTQPLFIVLGVAGGFRESYIAIKRLSRLQNQKDDSKK